VEARCGEGVEDGVGELSGRHGGRKMERELREVSARDFKMTHARRA
jgi:hypothetical protein